MSANARSITTHDLQHPPPLTRHSATTTRIQERRRRGNCSGQVDYSSNTKGEVSMRSQRWRTIAGQRSGYRRRTFRSSQPRDATERSPMPACLREVDWSLAMVKGEFPRGAAWVCSWRGRPAAGELTLWKGQGMVLSYLGWIKCGARGWWMEQDETTHQRG
jgi:hypothetical protein